MLQLHIPCSYLLHTGFISNYCTQLSFDAPTCFGHVLQPSSGSVIINTQAVYHMSANGKHYTSALYSSHLMYSIFIHLAIGDTLQAPSYLSKVDHQWKIRARKQRKDIGKYSFVNRTITDWNKLTEGAIGTSHSKTRIFKTRVRKV